MAMGALFVAAVVLAAAVSARLHGAYELAARELRDGERRLEPGPGRGRRLEDELRWSADVAAVPRDSGWRQAALVVIALAVAGFVAGLSGPVDTAVVCVLAGLVLVPAWLVADGARVEARLTEVSRRVPLAPVRRLEDALVRVDRARRRSGHAHRALLRTSAAGYPGAALVARVRAGAYGRAAARHDRALAALRRAAVPTPDPAVRVRPPTGYPEGLRGLRTLLTTVPTPRLGSTAVGTPNLPSPRPPADGARSGTTGPGATRSGDAPSGADPIPAPDDPLLSSPWPDPTASPWPDPTASSWPDRDDPTGRPGADPAGGRPRPDPTSSGAGPAAGPGGSPYGPSWTGSTARRGGTAPGGDAAGGGATPWSGEGRGSLGEEAWAGAVADLSHAAEADGDRRARWLYAAAACAELRDDAPARESAARWTLDALAAPRRPIGTPRTDPLPDAVAIEPRRPETWAGAHRRARATGAPAALLAESVLRWAYASIRAGGTLDEALAAATEVMSGLPDPEPFLRVARPGFEQLGVTSAQLSRLVPPLPVGTPTP
jgi:hypothetical protein